VKNAFLYNDLDEEVYIEQPSEYVALGESMVCKLKKAIYDLKQSPRAWFEKFNRVVSENGFQHCHFDNSMFIRQSSVGFIILALYVDDILLTGNDPTGIGKAKAYLKAHFVTKDMGRPRYFVGSEISHSIGSGSFSMKVRIRSTTGSWTT